MGGISAQIALSYRVKAKICRNQAKAAADGAACALLIQLARQWEAKAETIERLAATASTEA